MLKDNQKGSKRGPKAKKAKEAALLARRTTWRIINDRDDLAGPTPSEHGDKAITSLDQMLTAFDTSHIQSTSLPSLSSRKRERGIHEVK